MSKIPKRLSKIHPNAFYVAAHERLRESLLLLDGDRPGASLWVSGVATECIFLAYWRAAGHIEHNAGHDLRSLYSLAYAKIVPSRHAEKIGAAVGHLADCWRNLHRYRAHSTVNSWLSEMHAREYGGHLRGDYVSYHAKRAYDDASEIIDLGADKWTRSD